MIFPFLILLRILFAACMVFIIGYIFGGFSRKRVLANISKVAAILVIVLFIGMNVLLMRAAFRQFSDGWRGCGQQVHTEKQG
ncbi:hypothetical protein [Chitinophaga flava]|uniref:Uncharacterized protein n=1 Tax=Chitinophaga flava TaxID=2259036 RepID=A0A365Y370_9BACT|nr:hypothetical protein [Chitinophaga flava]RBL92778.1 hypothetical protein DF182_09425 [Chitinophaga flava]